MSLLLRPLADAGRRGKTMVCAVSCTKHVWYSEHGMYCQFEIILERAMSATHVAVILRTRTSPAYEEEFTKMDYPDASGLRDEYLHGN